jgi:hypothetical protein
MKIMYEVVTSMKMAMMQNFKVITDKINELIIFKFLLT